MSGPVSLDATSFKREMELARQYGPMVPQTLYELLDQLEAAGRLVSRGRQAYDSDEMLVFAAEAIVVRAGECVARMDQHAPEFVREHPGLNLRDMKDARNFVAHGYDSVEADVLWDVISTFMPTLKAGVTQFLAEGGA